ncbi:unnamed protein product [Rotaria socialis]|uniref:Mono(ADP-ribosyl)transferase n=1 Tax=Rotaria socialis TaxID=392032 RepID=A0A818US91_9BILA|nr:unnamed protein product [Rotaria socialis]CAF3370981.1 unnamed protein product [Rotaria socialis]CAF3460295.1 unnamed protein product [Rotaria socialis]CAF3705291.1 unnamed protein product [Rotaria socialis]CAF4495508.1 unnamed protein product [Rotaria socialis]
MATGSSLPNKKCTIIWLDSEANNSEDNLFTQQTLFQVFDNVEIYDSENECQQLIESKSNNSFLIIVSGRLSRQIIPNINELRQVSGIYIYCMDKSRHEEWSKQYSKIKAIIVDLTALVSQIRSDLKEFIQNKRPKPVVPQITPAVTPNPNHVSSTHREEEALRELEETLGATSINDTKCPFADYQKVPLVSLEEAVAPLVDIVDKVEQMVWIVKQNCDDNPTDGLTKDESASIALYTMEWYSKEMSFHYILNETLSSENKQQIKPWLLYLKLMLKGLSKLPSLSRVVYQGANSDLSNQYPNGKTFCSWEFSNYASCIKVLEDEEDFGKEGQRTLFTVECRVGKAIGPHAHDQSKDQILLLPGRQLQVVSCLNAGNDLTIVQLQELETSYKLK